MGALATLAPWIPEDDLLLKNAVEAGASLESLAKGAVQFSRKYNIREIQDRWYSLLYDPVISAEASAGMTNFELSASPLPSKFYRFGHSKEQKVVSTKRKSGSVRNLYYARLKRIRNSMLTSMDLSFLVDPGNGNYAEHESHPLSGTCMPEGGTLNLPVQYDFPPENVMDDNVVSNGVPASVFFPGIESAVEENLPVQLNNVLKEEPQFIGDNVPLDEAVEELDIPGELTIDGWIGDDNLGRIPLPTLDDINNDPGNMCPDFDEKNAFDSTELECGTSFNLASLPEIPVWSTDEGIKESDLPCDGFNDSIACGEAYLEELSNSLLNFSSEEELFLMDVDGEEGIDKSYFDGLSSLLLNSTNDVNPSQVPKKDEAELQVPKTDGTESLTASQAHVLNQSVSCHKELEDNPGSTSSGVQVVHKLEFQMSSPPLAEDPLFHELTNEFPFCSLNTEEQEIPDNEDVFLPFDVPPVIFPPSSKLIFKASKKRISSSVQDYGFNRHRANERGKSLMHAEKKIRVESQSSSQMMGSPSFLVPDGGSKVKCELPASHASRIVSTTSVTVSGSLGGNDAANTTNALLRANRKEEATNADLAKDQCDHISNLFIKKSAASSNDLRNNPQLHGSAMKNEQDLGLSLQNHQLKVAEVGSSDILESELVADPLTLDEEEHDIESDDELPSYSDVEAMVLDMDLDPDDHQDSCYSEEVSGYQHVESKRAIMRLEQGAHSCIQRAINAHGAFAILYGRHTKHYIKKPEVLLGRATEGFPVDIDLSKGGYSNSISRRQAIIKMDKEGSFYIKNFGKSSILVNSKEVHTGQSQRLHTNYLIEVRGIPLIFEINQNRVKRYLDHISDNSQTF
ncbi:microspherule protein 1 [Vigna unguiculata]|uniref:Microspherule protein 1 n=1 Tax=Vigna unguiculata TaxID=3917 RepID=A0A4D6NRX1_VIGUN|nr:microspherule protein 1 [Vigna unguiculata]